MTKGSRQFEHHLLPQYVIIVIFRIQTFSDAKGRILMIVYGFSAISGIIILIKHNYQSHKLFFSINCSAAYF